MDKNQCKAVKLNKQRCERSAREGSEYCLRHRISRFSDARWWNSTEIQGHICLITVLVTTIAIVFIPTLLHPKEFMRKVVESSTKIQDTILPVFTKKDAERPLSVEEKELLDEFEQGKKTAIQGGIKVGFTLKVRLANAGALLRLGKNEEAESAYKAILVDEPNNTLAMTGLGITLSKSGKYVEAEEILKKVLITERANDPNSTNIAIAMNNLAEFYQDRGKLSEAESFCKQALESSEMMLGQDHPYVVITMNNLADLYETQGKLTEAEPLYKRAVEIAEKNWGPDNPNTTKIKKNLDSCRGKIQGKQ
jgi:tetratricopeptide (TPR) repeat protein